MLSKRIVGQLRMCRGLSDSRRRVMTFKHHGNLFEGQSLCLRKEDVEPGIYPSGGPCPHLLIYETRGKRFLVMSGDESNYKVFSIVVTIQARTCMYC
jgi:hypothetical protein